MQIVHITQLHVQLQRFQYLFQNLKLRAEYTEKRNLIEKKTIWLGKYFFLIDLYEFMYFYLRIFFFVSKENPSNSREADIYTESKIKTVMKTF